MLVEWQGIGYDAEGSAYAERRLEDGHYGHIPVVIEPFGSAYVKIVSGLNAGDKIRRQQSSDMGGMRVRDTGSQSVSSPPPDDPPPPPEG